MNFKKIFIFTVWTFASFNVVTLHASNPCTSNAQVIFFFFFSWRDSLHVESIQQAQEIFHGRHDTHLDKPIFLKGADIQHQDLLLNNKTYTKFRFLGQGTNARVYLAFDGQKLVVIKHYAPRNGSMDSIKILLLKSDILYTQFLDAKGFQVARVLDSDETQGIIIKEFVPGASYNDLLRGGEFSKQNRENNPIYMQYLELVNKVQAIEGKADFREFATTHKLKPRFDIGEEHYTGQNARYYFGQWIIVDP